MDDYFESVISDEPASLIELPVWIGLATVVITEIIDGSRCLN